MSDVMLTVEDCDYSADRWEQDELRAQMDGDTLKARECAMNKEVYRLAARALRAREWCELRAEVADHGSWATGYDRCADAVLAILEGREP